MKTIIRNATSQEYNAIGELIAKVYTQLKGFPTEEEQPNYYKKLKNIGNLTQLGISDLIVAVENDHILGAVLYISNMRYYGSRGDAPKMKDAAGFRFLAVDITSQGRGIGKLLSLECIKRSKDQDLKRLIIHSTEAMKVAWQLYLTLGFERKPSIDFRWDGYGVYGFEYLL